MEIISNYTEKTDELYKKLGNNGYVVSVDGCCDANYFTTKKECIDYAKKLKRTEKRVVYVAKLEWNSETEEYESYDL